jgi:hypothetical protein
MPQPRFWQGVAVFRNWPLWVILIVAFAAFATAMSGRITPEMYRSMTPPLGYVFVPDDDTFIDSEQKLEINFVQMGRGAPSQVTAHITRHPSDPTENLEFEPLAFHGEPTQTWFAILPPLHNKADRWFYYITVETTEDRTIEIWKHMNWFEKLFSGFRKEHQLFWVTYEGNVVREMKYGKLALVSHIVLSLGALIYMFHAFYYIMWLFTAPTGKYLRKTWHALLGAWISFTIGTIILGPVITWYTFAQGFTPWPVKGLNNLGDITDTKSLLLVVWWGILLLTNLKSVRLSIRGELSGSTGLRFAWWTLLALLVTAFVFLIPHSQFLS